MANLPIVADFVEPGTPTTDDQRPEFQHMIARIATISPFTDKALLESLSVRVWLTLSATLTRQSGSNQVSGPQSPENGNICEAGQRLSAIWPTKGAKWEDGDPASST